MAEDASVQRAAGSSTTRSRWPRDRVARALERYLAGRERWPSWSDFTRDGLKTLRAQVDLHGGAALWADELGVRYEPHAGRPAWSDARVRSELRVLARHHRRFPTAEEMREVPGLADAVARSGGVSDWAERIGAPPPPRSQWPDERIRRELRAFLAGHERWPAKREWVEAGQAALLDAVYRHPLGAQGWAAVVQVGHPTTRRRRGQHAQPSEG